MKKYLSRVAFDAQYAALMNLEKEKNRVESELLQYKQNASYLVRAPLDGIIATLSYKEGQYTVAHKALIKIVPKNADLVAELFIPVRQSGFISKNTTVRIRYDAYPFARFGTYEAKIGDISKTVLTDDEEDNPIKIGQPYYKVTSILTRSVIPVYGVPKKIRHGMTLSALIVGEKRSLWQWIFDPIYSFYGTIAA